jgi:hypothetical protein
VAFSNDYRSKEAHLRMFSGSEEVLTYYSQRAGHDELMALKRFLEWGDRLLGKGRANHRR